MRSTKILEKQFYGEEPVLKGDVTESQLTRALNWYNYMGDEEKGLSWLLDYLRKANYSSDIISKIRSAPKNRIRNTDCWLARMALNGSVLPKETLERFSARILEAANHKPKEEAVIPTISVQERVKRSTNALLALIEGELDDNPSFCLYDLLVDENASASAAEAVRAYYTPHLEEVMSTDPQVEEAYGSRLAFWKKVYKKMIQECEAYLEKRKATKEAKPRKPRKLKVKTPADLVRKIKIKASDTDLKVSSIDPQKIIGATHLWVYNTKYRTLGQYVTNSAKGFSVKGTTILNFDSELSKSRKLRKPQQQLAEFAQQGKVGLRKFMDTIRAKDGKLNGRLNSDTILLKVL